MWQVHEAQRQEGQEFKVSLGYLARSSIQKGKQGAGDMFPSVRMLATKPDNVSVFLRILG